MPRPQIFVETDVIDAAMHLFWSQGYVATGMSQVLEATSLKPGSFYNAFGSKKVLFIRSLEHYNSNIVARRISTHLTAENPIDAIEHFFLSAFETIPASALMGCLLTNTATEVGKTDFEINRVVCSGLKQIESAFKNRVIQAGEQGLLGSALESEAAALHLLSCFQGMNVIGRATQNKARLRSLTRTALQILH